MKKIKRKISRSLLFLAVALGLMAAMLVSEKAQAGPAVTIITLTNSTMINTNTLNTTNIAPGPWTSVPQNTDGYFYLTQWSAPGTLNGTSNLNVWLDTSPDQVTVVSNAYLLNGSFLLNNGTSSTAFFIPRTNSIGQGFWRIGKAGTGQLTNGFFNVKFAFPFSGAF